MLQEVAVKAISKVCQRQPPISGVGHTCLIELEELWMDELIHCLFD